jgi:hypothetical protein
MVPQAAYKIYTNLPVQHKARAAATHLAEFSGVIGKVQKSARLAVEFALDRNFAAAGDNHRFRGHLDEGGPEPYNPVIPLLEAVRTWNQADAAVEMVYYALSMLR